MKKNYIVPTIKVASCLLEQSFLAGSDPSNQKLSQISDDPESEITKEDNNSEGFEQGAKGFNSWSSWDD